MTRDEYLASYVVGDFINVENGVDSVEYADMHDLADISKVAEKYAENNIFDMEDEPERIDYGVRWNQADLDDLFVNRVM